MCHKTFHGPTPCSHAVRSLQIGQEVFIEEHLLPSLSVHSLGGTSASTLKFQFNNNIAVAVTAVSELDLFDPSVACTEGCALSPP